MTAGSFQTSWSRSPAVAGQFYAGDAEQLRAAVRGFLHEAQQRLPVQNDGVAPALPGVAGAWPKAIIAPHAGYRYSGPIAASAYCRLRAACGTVSRVVLMGPAHRVTFTGVAGSSAASFCTPLGTLPVDRQAMQRLLALSDTGLLDVAHEDEHCLEVHLPFIQEVLGEVHIVPLVVGRASGRDVALVLEALWGGPETLIVISSDLSHLLDHGAATALDRRTSDAIEELRPEEIGPHQACGRSAIQGLLTLASAYGLKATTVDLRNSGDTAGPRDQVVGYGAYIFQ